MPDASHSADAALPRAETPDRRIDAALRALIGSVDRTLGATHWTRYGALLVFYAAELAIAFYTAYEIRWDFDTPPDFVAQRAVLIWTIVGCKLLLLHSFGQFRSMLSYFSLADFSGIVVAMSAASGIMLGLWYFAEPAAAPPRGVILADFVFSIGLLAAFRLSLRMMRSRVIDQNKSGRVFERRIGILGAGDVGSALAKDLLARRGSGLRPVVFLDDDSVKIGRSLHGLAVRGPISGLADVAKENQLNEIIIAMPSATPKKIKEIVDLCRHLGLKVELVPSVTQLALGEVKIDRVRPVELEDLLGREPVNLDSDEIARLIEGRTVLVTGAGGSIGAELCRQILANKPRELVLVEQTEIALFDVEGDLAARAAGIPWHGLIADVTDEARMAGILATHRPELVFHAAAHKHVPLMERQPGEALKNNTLGTAHLARLASGHGVGRFILISTDKAINPTSVMGVSKRLAEKAIQAVQHSPENKTVFMAVRFGNVLGSSGSVIPVFKKQITQGGPVTVTHPDVTRYFMTIPEAVGLVLQAATQGTGGEIFVLDMGAPVKIHDVARQLIELSGYRPGVDIEIEFVGLRPGEKLFEELQHSEESHEATPHPRVLRLKNAPDGNGTGPASAWLGELRQAIGSETPAQLRARLRSLVPEYTPFEG
ncbi:MAG TPA: nucleoside-diphosphate sugar epimerase/dehydratase [Opitutaceae bacterium]